MRLDLIQLHVSIATKDRSRTDKLGTVGLNFCANLKQPGELASETQLNVT